MVTKYTDGLPPDSKSPLFWVMIHIHEAVFKTILGNLILLWGAAVLTALVGDAVVPVSEAVWLNYVGIPIILTCAVIGTLPVFLYVLDPYMTGRSIWATMTCKAETPPAVYPLLDIKPTFERLLVGPGPEERIYNSGHI